MKLIASVILLVIVTCGYSLNILAIYPYQGLSHFLVFKVYLRELAKRGHNLTVISHFPEKDPPKNYHDISLAGTVKGIEDWAPPIERTFLSVIQTGIFLVNSGIENCEVMLANKKVQDLVTNKQKFDVIVVELFNGDCALGLAYQFGAPVVSTSSHVLMPYHFNRFGIPSNPSFVSFHFSEGGTKPSLFQRVERVILDIYFKTIYRFVSQRTCQSILAKYFDNVPDLEDLGREIKFHLVYNYFTLTGSKLMPPNVIEVGGYHLTTAKPLSGDLKEFVEGAEHGVIYISFGSVVRASRLPADKIQAILEAMNELPQRFIWKWENKTISADRNKLYVDSWLPQVDILGHPKTLAFFAHGGMGGTAEAIHFGVPIVAMPILGDQPSNAAAIEESGYGLTLQIGDLNKENLVAALKTILDPKFRKKAKEVSAAWHDRPMLPIDTAIFWTEFAARNPSLSFRTSAADVPLYQYYSLDILAIFAITTLVIFKAIAMMCKGTKRNLKRKTKSEEETKKQKKRLKRE